MASQSIQINKLRGHWETLTQNLSWRVIHTHTHTESQLNVTSIMSKAGLEIMLKKACLSCLMLLSIAGYPGEHEHAKWDLFLTVFCRQKTLKPFWDELKWRWISSSSNRTWESHLSPRQDSSFLNVWTHLLEFASLISHKRAISLVGIIII